MSNKHQIIGLNWLRFFAGLYIVLFHTLPGYSISKDETISTLLDFGNLATSVFFVLSGFLLSYIYLSGANKSFGARKFLLSRVSTIYPLHLLALVIAAPSIFALVLVHGGITYTSSPNSLDVLNWSQAGLSLLLTLTLTHAWNPWYIPFNMPSWSLSALLFFYLVFAAIGPRIRLVTRPIQALFILGILFAAPGLLADLMNLHSHTVDGVLHHNPLIRLPLFLSGMVLSEIYSRLQIEPCENKSIAKMLILIVACTLAAKISLEVIYGETQFHFVQNGLYFPCALAIVWLAASKRTTANEWNRIWSLRLGKTALPLFLLHLPLFDLYSRSERFISFFVLNKGNELTLQAMAAAARSVEPNLWLYPVFLVALIWISIVVQEKFVEPVQRRIRNILPASPTTR